MEGPRPTQPGHRLPLVGTAWRLPLAAIWLLAAVGIAAGFMGAPGVQAAVIVGAAAVVGTVLILAWSRSLDRRLSQVETRARRLLVERSESSPSGPDEPAPLTPVEDRYTPLERILFEADRLMSTRVKAAAKKHRNLEALIDAMDEPVLATDNADRVLLYNKSAEAMLGMGQGSLLGRPFEDLFTQAQIREMHASARRGETRRGRVKMVTSLGSRTMQVSSAPVPVAWGEGIFGAVLMLRDVTELDQAVQVKTDFVANASHELRTPVAAVRGAAETLLGAIHEDAGMAERLVKMILGHSNRLEEMLRDLLDLSRLETPDLPVTIEVIDLEEVERNLRGQFEEACSSRKLSLAFEFDDDLAGMKTDRKLLTLVLRNLIENATKFAYEGSTVTIRGSLIEERADLAASAVSKARLSEGVARFEVQDAGVGIPLQHQDRVFERYYQVDPARTGTGASAKRGTGLGLAIVKHAARALGGRVGLSSVWREGTLVWAEWPVGFDQSPHPNPLHTEGA